MKEKHLYTQICPKRDVRFIGDSKQTVDILKVYKIPVSHSMKTIRGVIYILRKKHAVTRGLHAGETSHP